MVLPVPTFLSSKLPDPVAVTSSLPTTPLKLLVKILTALVPSYSLVVEVKLVAIVNALAVILAVVEV